MMEGFVWETVSFFFFFFFSKLVCKLPAENACVLRSFFFF